ncbi:hypothetical protein [Haloarcula marina]|uniref:hypothetical protein n=1 Tax=Haloarcula marina TaxID=2961574 RepID=UPI0020B780C2|nr:hypothetical protein [Halomicroarcula marina]
MPSLSPPNTPTRRAVLGAVSALLAGCSSRPDTSGTAPSDQPTDSSAPDRRTASPTPSERTLTLGPVRGDPFASGPVTVYRRPFADAIRHAAAGDAPARGVVETPVQAPEIPLGGVDRVAVEDPVGDAGGTYALALDSGAHVTVKLDLTEVNDPSPTATVYDAADLPKARRDAVAEAVGDGRAEVPIQRPTAQWILDELLGNAVRYENATYRAVRHTGTDNGFFETKVYWVLELDPAEGDPEATLRLPDIDSRVRSVVDSLLANQRSTDGRSATVTTEGPVAAFARETDRLLGYDAVFEPTLSTP